MEVLTSGAQNIIFFKKGETKSKIQNFSDFWFPVGNEWKYYFIKTISTNLDLIRKFSGLEFRGCHIFFDH